MSRFQYGGRRASQNNQLFSLLIFVAALLLFNWALSALSARTEQEQRTSLEKALQRSVVRCYAVEGSYPESLQYLQENYGINYDSSRFSVKYEPQGENIFPDIVILEKQAEK